MSLSRFSNNSKKIFQRLLIMRFSPSNTTRNIPNPALRQVCVPRSEEGFFKYERDWSRDKRYVGQKLGDTPTRQVFFLMLLRKLGHTYELYPLFVLYGIFFVFLCITVYVSFERVEIWLDRSNPRPPWDWERVRDTYWKLPTLA
uniref:Uncharacterized protein n=1 Tax=Ascaris lumbricoides TaxID=6252 RepID=A0A0M3ICZ0_ASCLU